MTKYDFLYASCVPGSQPCRLGVGRPQVQTLGTAARTVQGSIQGVSQNERYYGDVREACVPRD
jgi:hypothetical protein